MLLARGSSHRTGTDAEMIRWAAPFARVDGHHANEAREADLDVTLVRRGTGGRPEAHPRQRRRPAGIGTGRGPSRRRLRPGGDAPRRRRADSPADGPRCACRSALPRLWSRPLHVRPRPDAAQPPAARDPRGAGHPRPAALLGREAAGSRHGDPRGAPPAPGRARRAAGRRARGDRARRGPPPPGLRQQRARPRPARRSGRRWLDASARPPRRRSGTAPRWWVRTATTWRSSWTGASSPPSRRAASSGRRSWPSSWRSSTCWRARRPPAAAPAG